jgi:hypothetical protein
MTEEVYGKLPHSNVNVNMIVYHTNMDAEVFVTNATTSFIKSMCHILQHVQHVEKMILGRYLVNPALHV